VIWARSGEERHIHTPDPSERYIFKAPVPAPLGQDKLLGAPPVPQSFSHRMMAQEPIRMKVGTVRITDSGVFPVSKTIAAALVEIEPGGLRELHWHPNTDKWQYYLGGQARMGVFAASGQARTFDFQAGDVGYVPFAMVTTSRTPAQCLCASWRCSRVVITPICRWISGWP
jgi:oxalate decarboxylase